MLAVYERVKTMRCPICWSEIRLGDKFCTECGATLNRVTHQIEKGKQQGQPIQASIMCVGVEGYIRLCEKLPLLEVNAVVNEYLERLLPAVERFGGKLDSFYGEKILAIFAQVDTDQAAKNVLQCAFKLHQIFAIFCEELMESYARDVELELRIGIASGEVLVAPAKKTSDIFHPAALGDAVNYAYQLEYESRAGHIITDETTANRATEAFNFVKVDERLLRRRSKPVTLFDVIGPKKIGTSSLKTPLVSQETKIDVDVLI